MLVEEMLDLLKISITKHARIRTDLAQDLPPVLAEAAEMRELLMNLILNASDALGEKDGEIRISTSCVEVGQAAAVEPSEYVPAGASLQLIVADTGPGISPEVQARIFEPFFTTKLPGRGVGLAIVQTIVRRYRGSIRLTSAPGQGTSFTVLLPCTARTAGMKGPAPMRSPAISGDGKTILIVEDEEGIRLAVSQLLRRSGFNVMEARDGLAAVELLRKHSRTIDIILLDLTLPGLPSREIVEEAARLRPDMRIFLTSAYSRETAAPAFNAPQVKGFLRKPYEIRELVRLLSEAYANSARNHAYRR
jgi:CheY-like chemotaxis protein